MTLIVIFVCILNFSFTMEKLFEVGLFYKISMPSLRGKEGPFYHDSTRFPNVGSFLSWVAFGEPD